MTNLISPTPYPDVNAVLEALLAGVRALLGEQLHGLYLYGSLASGDFSLRSSDIDFVVVTEGELAPKAVEALGALHARLAGSGLKWAKKLEGSYIPRDALRRYDPADPPRPTLNEGRFYMDQHGDDWVIQRHVLREQGVVVFGPSPHTLIDPVAPDEIRRAVRGIVRGWWEPMLDDHSFIRDREYEAFAVLTMCRVLHALAHGTIVSKPAAAGWAQQELGEPWAALIERALAWPEGPQPRALAETLDLIRLTANRV